MQVFQEILKTIQTKKVKLTLAFFIKNTIPFNLTRNEKALSCEDAAKKRYRNLKTGIPIEDELKTFFGEVRMSKNKSLLVLINLSGNDRIDFDKVRSIIGTNQNVSFVRKETMKKFDIKYGEVNPFLIHEKFYKTVKNSEFEKLIVLFDKSLLNKERSMMTNAGELTWGIEFRVLHIIHHFKNAIYSKSFLEYNKA